MEVCRYPCERNSYCWDWFGRCRTCEWESSVFQCRFWWWQQCCESAMITFIAIRFMKGDFWNMFIVQLLYYLSFVFVFYSGINFAGYFFLSCFKLSIKKLQISFHKIYTNLDYSSSCRGVLSIYFGVWQYSGIVQIKMAKNSSFSQVFWYAYTIQLI